MKVCDFCHCHDTEDNHVGVYRINAGAWGYVCERCKEIQENNMNSVERGDFLSETMPIENNTGLKVL